MSPQKQSRAPRRKPGLSGAELAKRHAFILRLIDEENATLSELINVLGLASPAEARRALKAARQWKQAQDPNFKPAKAARPAKIELTPPTPEEVARLADTEGCSFYEIARRYRMDAHHVQQLYVRFLEQETTAAVVQDAHIAQAAAAWEELGPAALKAVKAKRPSAARARGKATENESSVAPHPVPAAAKPDDVSPPAAATPGVSSRRTSAKPAKPTGSQKPRVPARRKSR